MDEADRKAQCRRFCENIKRDKRALRPLQHDIARLTDEVRRYRQGVQSYERDLATLRPLVHITEGLASRLRSIPSALVSLVNQYTVVGAVNRLEEFLARSRNELAKREPELRRLKLKRDELVDFINHSHQRRRELRCDDECS